MESADVRQARNPGPSWGFPFLRACCRYLPGPFLRFGVMIGSGVACLFMPRQRKNSAAYLRILLERKPTWRDSWKHFDTFAQIMVETLRVGTGGTHPIHATPQAEGTIRSLAHSTRPAIFGTFHVGTSDLAGFLLSDFQSPVTMVRLQVGNSADVDWLAQRFGGAIRFLWVNDPADILFRIKDVLQAGENLALKADRIEFSSRTAPFRFLGAWRRFPFSPYVLSLTFGAPLVFALGIPQSPQSSRVWVSTVFDPREAGRDRHAAARNHFQGVLDELENHLRDNPYLWFNFGSLNPVCPPPPSPS